jgi:L-Ala-D/L-Glu epimerase
LSPATTKSKLKLTYEKLTLTTKHPFGISYGTSSDHSNILVKLQYGDLEGFGEASPVEYHNESLDTCQAVLARWQKSEILGDDPFAISAVSQKLDKDIAGNYATKAAVEMAMHDLCGKLVGEPTYRMLGLQGLKAPMTDFTIGIDSVDMIEKKTKEAVDAGYKMLKVKQGTTFDKDIIKTVRKFAPNLPLRVDANGGWNVKQAIRMSEFLAQYDVELIEQPLPKNAHVEDFRIVREQSKIPIFADESICRSTDVARFAGAIDGVVVKLAKTGGILEALKVIHTARAHGMQVMFGMMIESSLGVTAAAQLMSLCDYLDLDGSLLLANDPFMGAEYQDGYLLLSDLPGLGVTPR